MVREIQAPTAEPYGIGAGEKTGTEESHPAFGVAVLTRGSNAPGAVLFQSDVTHQHSLTLSIRRATRARDLKHDWVHPREELIEIEMSEAQWGALVSSVGMGSGVPVTIRTTESERLVPGLPYQPRLAASVREAREAVAEITTEIDAALAELEHAIESKTGVKEVRDRLRTLRARVDNAPANAVFAIKSLNETAEKVVAQAKSDIEIHVMRASQLAGLEGQIAMPEITAGGEA